MVKYSFVLLGMGGKEGSGHDGAHLPDHDSHFTLALLHELGLLGFVMGRLFVLLLFLQALLPPLESLGITHSLQINLIALGPFVHVVWSVLSLKLVFEVNVLAVEHKGREFLVYVVRY